MVETGTQSRPIWRVRNLVLVGVALVLLIAAVLYGPTTWQVVRQRSTTISTPDQVAGLRRDQSDGAQETAEYVRDAVASSTRLNKSVGAVYLDPSSDSRTVIFVGGTAVFWTPTNVLDEVFQLITDDTGGVSGVRNVDAGPLGGVMRCGTTATPDGDMAVCGWADHGCVAVALFPSRGVDEAAKLIGQMRPAIQHRD